MEVLNTFPHKESYTFVVVPLTNMSEQKNKQTSLPNESVSPIQTYVGERIIEMRDEYQTLDSEVSNKLENFENLRLSGISSAEVYHSTVAAISARLQIGTTPGNPVLLNQYERAQTELAEVGAQGQMLVDLGNQIALLNTRISYLRDQTRSAKGLSNSNSTSKLG